MGQNICFICDQRSNILKNLTLHELEELSSHCSSVSFKKGETIFKQGAPVNQISFVREGLVKVFHNNGHRDFIIKIALAGEFLCLPNLFAQDIYYSSAIALIETDICFIDKGCLLKLIENNGKFARNVVTHISKDSFSSIQRLTNLINIQLITKLAEVILFFKNELFKTNSFELPLSRTELADYIGVSRKSLVRTLAEFKKDGIINIDDRTIEIIEPAKLEKIRQYG